MIYSVIEAIKNFFQLNNYGENEFTQSKFSILFMVIQGAISYSFIWLMYIFLDIVIGENQNIRSNILFFLGSSLLIFTIVRFVSNISLTSKALGQGLIPNLLDLNSIKNNFSIFSKTSGKLELNIIFLKIHLPNKVSNPTKNCMKELGYIIKFCAIKIYISVKN